MDAISSAIVSRREHLRPTAPVTSSSASTTTAHSPQDLLLFLRRFDLTCSAYSRDGGWDGLLHIAESNFVSAEWQQNLSAQLCAVPLGDTPVRPTHFGLSGRVAKLGSNCTSHGSCRRRHRVVSARLA